MATKRKKRDVWTFNFAKIQAVKDRVEAYFNFKVKEVRDQRVQLEEEWKRFFNMWMVQHDEKHNYLGRAELYIPEVRKNVEAQARSLTEVAFPNENFFDVVPGESGTLKGSVIQKSIRRWQIHQSGLRLKYQVAMRQAGLYGTSPIFVPWRKETERVFRSRLNKGNTKVSVGRENVEIFNGPDFVPRDIFKWYAMNPKKEDILSDGCFDISVLNQFDLEKMAREGEGIVGLDVILEGASDAFAEDALRRDVERMEQMGLSVTSQGYAGVAKLKDDGDVQDKSFELTNIFTKINLPEATEEGEDPEAPIPLLIKMVTGRVISVTRNPFFHQRPPYLIAKYILPNPDEFYGQGIPQAIKFMQYEVNSKAEQAMDSATYALNPIAFIDPALAHQTSDFNMEPGAQWFVNPAGVKFGSMPDVSQVGYNAISMLSQKMAEYSDRTPAIAPELKGKSRTATQADIVNRAVQVDLKAFQMQNEILVLNPMMEMWESLTDQNITEDQVIMTLGAESKQWKRALVSKNASLGRYRYFWNVASTLQNKAILGRSIIDMLKVTNLIPPEEKATLQINYQEIYRMLWTEAFSLPNADKLFGARNPETTDPELEHRMLRLGVDIEVLPGDEDGSHIDLHEKEMASLKRNDLKDALAEHIQQHQIQATRKIEILQQQVQRQRQIIDRQAQARAQGGGQGRPQGGMRTSQGSGNRAQSNTVGSQGDLASGVRA